MASTVLSIAGLLVAMAGGIAIGRCIAIWDDDIEFRSPLAVIGVGLVIAGFVIAMGASL